MKLHEIGEFGLIDRLAAILPQTGKGVVLAVGDDCAVLDMGSPSDPERGYWVWTTDAAIENRHYLPWLATPEQIGYKIMIANLSDVASMGAIPRFATVSLSAPADGSVEWTEGLYRGLAAAAAASGAVIVGGNTTRSPLGFSVDIGLLGEVERDRLMLRSGARPGDALLVTDTVGDAYCGLECVFKPRIPVPQEARDHLIHRYVAPAARVREGRVISGSRLATAMMDVSDGLAGDVAHICEQSNVGVELDTRALPISPEVRAFASAARDAGVSPFPAWRYALIGGDDYGLLLTCPERDADALARLIADETGTTLTRIGTITPPERGRTLVLDDGRKIALDIGSWQHFGGE